MPLGTKSLAFINHKPFHPGSMANMEKTWLAEKKHDEEQNQQKELQEKRLQEAKIEELRKALRISENAAAVSRKLTLAEERMEWMYENPATLVREKEQEEYRLGKKLEPQTSSDTKNLKSLEDTPGSLFLPSVSKQSEDTMRKIREDPLFQIRQAEIDHQKSRQNNPLLKMKLSAPTEEITPEELVPRMRKRSLSRSPVRNGKRSENGPRRREKLSSEERTRLVEEMKEEARLHEKKKEERIIRDSKKNELIEKVEDFYRSKKNGKSYFTKLNSEVAKKLC